MAAEPSALRAEGRQRIRAGAGHSVTLGARAEGNALDAERDLMLMMRSMFAAIAILTATPSQAAEDSTARKNAVDLQLDTGDRVRVRINGANIEGDLVQVDERQLMLSADSMVRSVPLKSI